MIVSGRLVTTGDTGTYAQHGCCYGNCKGMVDRVIIGQSKRWVVGGRDTEHGDGRWIRGWKRDGMGEWAKAALCLHSIGKKEEGEEGKKFLEWDHVAVDRFNWGVETCIRTHIKGMMSIGGDSQWKLLNTYTDIELQARQQGEIVRLS